LSAIVASCVRRRPEAVPLGCLLPDALGCAEKPPVSARTAVRVWMNSN